MSTTVQITGGNFQDTQGNVLNKGYLTFELSQDAQANSNTNICAGRTIKVNLDSSGSIPSSPATYLWPNDVLSPANTFYTVKGYNAQGQLVWGPNSQQVFSTPSPFDVGEWVPNIANVSTSSVITYDIGVFFPGVPAANQLLLLLPVERVVRFAANLSPSAGAVGTNPTNYSTFVLKQNGVQFATMSVATNGAVSFSSSGATFNAGDVLSIYAPSSQDATLSDVGITLSGVALASNT